MGMRLLFAKPRVHRLTMCALYFDALWHPIGAMAMWVLVGVGLRRASIILRGSAAPIGYLSAADSDEESRRGSVSDAASEAYDGGDDRCA